MTTPVVTQAVTTQLTDVKQGGASPPPFDRFGQQCLRFARGLELIVVPAASEGPRPANERSSRCGQELLFESLYRNGGGQLSCRRAPAQAGRGHTSVCPRPLLLMLRLSDGLPPSRYGPCVAPCEPICDLSRHRAREDQRPRENALAVVAHRLANLSSLQPRELSKTNAHGVPRGDRLSGNTPAAEIRLQDHLPGQGGPGFESPMLHLKTEIRNRTAVPIWAAIRLL